MDLDDLWARICQEERAFFSSTGPVATSNRIAPQLMAPGDEENNANNMGMRSEFSCRSNDNDQLEPVECDTVSAKEGTSFGVEAAWVVNGVVSHWGHIHRRSNVYRARYRIAPFASDDQADGEAQATWKISAIEVLEHERSDA